MALTLWVVSVDFRSSLTSGNMKHSVLPEPVPVVTTIDLQSNAVNDFHALI